MLIWNKIFLSSNSEHIIVNPTCYSKFRNNLKRNLGVCWSWFGQNNKILLCPKSKCRHGNRFHIALHTTHKSLPVGLQSSLLQQLAVGNWTREIVALPPRTNLPKSDVSMIQTTVSPIKLQYIGTSAHFSCLVLCLCQMSRHARHPHCCSAAWRSS
jgi:hypothetical protein